MIFYFTGTGNSYYVAKRIAEIRKERLISIAFELKNEQFLYELQENESIGFVYPVHGWAPPNVVLEFAKKLRFKNYNQNYIYSIFTCAGEWEYTVERLKKILDKNNLILQGSYKVLMPGNYVLAENKIPQSEEQRRVDEAHLVVDEIIKQINGKVNNYKKEKHSFIKSYVINELLLLTANSFRFEVNDVCKGCGICERACPTQNIKMINHKPKQLKNCILCMGCINCCPEQAIEFSNKTKGKKRYKHPDYQV